jgi:hypothetical protein
MGGGPSYSASSYSSYRTTTNTASATSAQQIYKSTTIDASLDPKNFSYRESCDIDGKHATPIILGLDITGSMGDILVEMAQKGFPKIMQELFDRKPIEHMNILACGIGDVKCDSYSFQATQFESNVKVIEQADKIYFEEGGGGNGSESYILTWLFASFMVKADHISKRNKKGYIFTFGDDGITPNITPEECKRVFGKAIIEKTLTSEELYTIVSRDWYVYHINLTRGLFHMRHSENSWRNVIGEHLISLDDHTRLPEVIISLIQMNEENMSAEDVANTWDGTTSMILKSVLPSVTKKQDDIIVF